MYSYYELFDEPRAQLEEVEATLDRPIVLVPRRHQDRDISYWMSQYPDCFENIACSTAQADERGIKLIFGTSASGDYRAEWQSWVEGYDYEFVIPSTEPAMPIFLEDKLIGEIAGREIYCYLEWPSYQTQPGPTQAVLTYIEAIKSCIDPELLAHWDEHMETMKREALSRFIAQTYDRNVTEIRQRIDSYQASITMSTTAIADALRRLRTDQEMLDAILLQRENDAGEQIEREFELLKNHSRCDSCEFTGSRIVITTTDDLRLYRPDTDESRWLGRFKISIDLSTLEITAENLDTRRGGRDHPHITNGNPCLGGHARDIADLMGRGELYTVFELLIQYFETLNLADEYGRYGAYWFDVEDERPLEAPAEAVAA